MFYVKAIIEAVNRRLRPAEQGREVIQPPKTAPKAPLGAQIKGRVIGMSEFQRAVNSMSNYRRNQWARAGYPGLQHADVKPLLKFGGRP